MTVRDLVRDMQREIRDTDLQPERATELLNKLSALMGNCNDEIREADMAFNVTLMRHLDGEEAANRAKIRAQTTPEYRRLREAKDTKDLVVELCRSLKYYLRAKFEEMRMGG